MCSIPWPAAGTAAKITLAQLLDHKRAARMNGQQLADAGLPSFADMLSIVINDRWPEARMLPGRHRANGAGVLVDELASLLGHKSSRPQYVPMRSMLCSRFKSELSAPETGRWRVMPICSLLRVALRLTLKTPLSLREGI